VPEAVKVRSRAVASTARQNAALGTAHELVIATQRNGQGSTPKAYGVGRKLNPKIVKGVSAAPT
jgi:hypothetical protein